MRACVRVCLICVSPTSLCPSINLARFICFLSKKIHVERLSSNDDVIIKSRLSFVVCSRLFARAPVYFRKWPLIRTAPSLSSREGRVASALYSRYRKSSSTRTNFRGRRGGGGPPVFPLPSLTSRDATIKDSSVMETVDDIHRNYTWQDFSQDRRFKEKKRNA